MSPSSPAAASGVMRQRKAEAETGPRRVLITGATRGIGRAMALRIAREGYEVVITGRKPSPQADEVLKALEDMGAKAHALYFDVTDRAAAQTALTEFTAEQGPFWGVILNAGINRDGPLAGMSEEDWDLVLETDLGGFYNVLKPLILPMARRRSGRIVVMSSVSGITGTRGQTNYSAAKAGLIGAAKALSAELASRGITVNVIAPGVIDTDMVTAEDRERILPYVPMRRLGKPEEVAGLAAFLLSDEAGYITRAVIPVSGGISDEAPQYSPPRGRHRHGRDLPDRFDLGRSPRVARSQ